MTTTAITSRRYQVLYPVGKGGFGTVYRAKLIGDGGFHKDVAIKLMNQGLEAADEIASRQRDEARILGLIRHRAILQVDGLVRLNGTWAVVMEYIDGANLKQVLRSGQVPLTCSLEIASEVAAALHVAYSTQAPDGSPLRLIHRDIKPENVQVTAAGEIKLLDFGIARAEFDSRESETVGVILGTFRYMSPERLDGIDGPEGDVYALGVTLVELITRRPFQKTSSRESKHAETVLLAVSRIRESVPEHADALIPLIERVLAYDESSRPTAAELRDELYQVRDAITGPRMEAWAHDRVRDIQAQNKSVLANDPLEGATLIEQTSTRVRATGPIAVSNRGMIGSLAAIGVVAVALLGVGSFGLYTVMTQAPTGTTPQEPVSTAPVEPIPTDPEPTVIDEPEGAEIEPEPAPVEKSPAASKPQAPAPIPVTKKPKSVPAAAPAPAKIELTDVRKTSATAKFELVEDLGWKVKLRDGEGTYFDVGMVPPGTYTITAILPNQTSRTEFEAVSIASGNRVEIKCEPQFTTCRAL